MDAFDRRIHRNTRYLLQATLTSEQQAALPQPSGLWSVTDNMLQSSSHIPLSLSGMKKAVNKGAMDYAAERKDDPEVQAVARFFSKDAAPWFDLEGFVVSYHELVDTEVNPIPYTRLVQSSS